MNASEQATWSEQLRKMNRDEELESVLRLEYSIHFFATSNRENHGYWYEIWTSLFPEYENHSTYKRWLVKDYTQAYSNLEKLGFESLQQAYSIKKYLIDIEYETELEYAQVIKYLLKRQRDPKLKPLFTDFWVWYEKWCAANRRLCDKTKQTESCDAMERYVIFYYKVLRDDREKQKEYSRKLAASAYNYDM